VNQFIRLSVMLSSCGVLHRSGTDLFMCFTALTQGLVRGGKKRSDTSHAASRTCRLDPQFKLAGAGLLGSEDDTIGSISLHF